MTDPRVTLPEVKLTVATATPAPFKTANASPNMDARVQNDRGKTSDGTSPGASSDARNESRQGLLDRELLDKQVEEANREYEKSNISIRFSIDDDTKSLVIKVIDKNTDTVIRQIPPEELLAIRRQMHEVLGNMFDTQA